MIYSDCVEIPTEAEKRSQGRRRLAVVTRRLAPMASIAPVPFPSSSHERSRDLLEEAFDNGMYHISCGYFVVFHDCSSFLVLVVSDHFSNAPVATPNNATGRHLVTLCRSICAEERAQILEPLMSSEYCFRTIHVCSFACAYSSLGAWFFRGLGDVLGRVERLEQRSPRIVPHTFETTDTSGDETDVSEPQRTVRSKRTYKMKKVWGANELSRFFVTGPTDASGKPIRFYWQICRKDVCVITHGVHEILRNYQGT